MIRIENIINLFEEYTEGEYSCSPLQKAWVLAVKHFSQPFLVGLNRLDMALERAQILVDLHADLPSLVAALLLDVPRLEKSTWVELEQQLGQETTEILKQVTLLMGLANEPGALRQKGVGVREVISAAITDLRPLLVSLAARQIQLSHWSSFAKGRVKPLAKDALEIYAPLAERLGLNQLKANLENLAFTYLHPKEAKEIQGFLQKNERHFQDLLQTFRGQVSRLLQEHAIEAQVKCRIKHAYSLYQKSRRTKMGYEHIHDLLGVRVIVQSVDAAYQVLGLINNAFHPLQDRYKNYISFPKPNGYQSIHAFVFDRYGQGFDVQIRTAEMHQIAEYGVASHWSYKVGGGGLRESSLQWLKELAARLNLTDDPEEALEIFNRELYSDQIYVFTPKGKIITLPLGATVLDFAYAIHSEVGNHCTGALINGVNQAISNVLKQGDKIEVLTRNDQWPKPDWLLLAKTAKALTHIKTGLRKKEGQEARKLGEEILIGLLAHLGQSSKELHKNEEFQDFLKRSKLKSLEEYQIKLGFGQANPQALQRFLQSGNLGGKRRLGLHYFKKPTGVKVLGVEDTLVRYANCCNPVKGDPIVGVRLKHKGVSIHLADCKNAHTAKITPDKQVEVEWVKTKLESLPAWIHLEYPESIKTQRMLLKLIQTKKIPLLESNLRVVSGKTQQDLLIRVSSRAQLATLLKKINGTAGLKAERKLLLEDHPTVEN